MALVTNVCFLVKVGSNVNMTFELESQKYAKSHSQGDLPALKAGHGHQSIGAINMLKRDRFELLSAYLDGEVTSAQRQQVEDWLANDLEVQCLYARLLKLRQGLRTLPIPPSEQPVEQTIQQVFGRLNRRQNPAVAWCGFALAAVFISALLGGRQFIAPELAQLPEPATAPSETLMVALNTPVVEIPKAAVAVPDKAFKQTGFPQQQIKNNLN